MNKNDLRRHRGAKGHRTLLLEQSRYNRYVSEPLVHANGDEDALSEQTRLYDVYRANQGW